MDDVIIIGGSFAGLTAASHLVRARRSVTILDTGRPRNRFAAAAHNVLGYDGVSPIVIRQKALKDVLAYPTARYVEAEAVGVGGARDDFVVRTADGTSLNARRIILAYGVVDQLPAIPGFADCWGKTVIHCPYCHGYEVAGRPLGILYSSPASLHAPILLRDWTDDLTLFSNGLDLPDGEEARIKARGNKVLEGTVAEFLHRDGQLSAVRMESGREIPLGAMLAHPKSTPSSRLHEDIGAETREFVLGQYLTVDDEMQTTVPGVFAAGDLAGPRHSINNAVYDGTIAGVGCHRSLLDWS